MSLNTGAEFQTIHTCTFQSQVGEHTSSSTTWFK